MSDDLFEKLLMFVRDGGSTRAALDRAREEVDYWRDLAENYLHRIKSVQLENTGLYGKLVEKDRALAYKEDELHSVRLEIAEFRQVTETGRADRGLVRAVESEFDDTANGNRVPLLKGACAQTDLLTPTDSPASRPLVSEVGSEERKA